MKKSVVFTPRGFGGHMAKVKAKLINFEGYEQFEFVVVQMTYEPLPSWWKKYAVSELSTGCYIAIGSTEEIAIRKAYNSSPFLKICHFH